MEKVYFLISRLAGVSRGGECLYSLFLLFFLFFLHFWLCLEAMLFMICASDTLVESGRAVKSRKVSSGLTPIPASLADACFVI